MTQYVQEKVEKIEHPITAWILLSIVVILVALYSYFINATIQNIVVAKEMRTEISTLTSSLGKLEAEYLSQKSVVSEDYGRQLGYMDSLASTRYITKSSQSSLSFNR